MYLIYLRGGGIASFSFILFFYLYWYSYIIVYFVCDSASEFGEIGSTSFWGLSYPNLLVVFLNLLFFRNLFIFFIFFICIGIPIYILFVTQNMLWAKWNSAQKHLRKKKGKRQFFDRIDRWHYYLTSVHLYTTNMS